LDPIVGPIGIVCGVLVVAFGLIALVRGFLKEIGVTTVLLIVLFAFHQWGEKTIAPAAVDLVQAAAGMLSADPPEENAIAAACYIIVMVIATFASYHGETLSFRGRSPGGLAGVFLALVIGLVNGYLVAGTIWFYLQEFGYPFGLFPTELTPLEQGLVELLPLAALSPFLPFLAVFMVILRVVR
jgi:hypothetical protein